MAKQTRKTFKTLANNFSQIITSHGTLGESRRRYEGVDRLLEKESDNSKEALRGKAARSAGRKDRMASAEIPICQIKKDTAHAYLAGTFLNAIPIFAAVSTDRARQDSAAQLNILTKRDQIRFAWVAEFLRSFDDVLRYNVAPMEISWATRHMAKADTNIVAGTATTGAVSAIAYEGVRIRRLDPYNSFWDETVEPHEVARRGSHAGYVESLTRVETLRLIRDLNEDFTFTSNLRIVHEGNSADIGGKVEARSDVKYYIPQINPAVTVRDPEDFSGFFAPSTPKGEKLRKGCHRVTTVYVRVIPEDLDIVAVSSDSMAPQIYKCIYVDNLIIYAEALAQGTELLPIVVGQLYPGNRGKKSFVEYIADLQDLATANMHASLASLRRAVDDRALYDPTRIEKQDVESKDPARKIPVTRSLLGGTLAEAYYQIPYEDRVSPMFGNMLQTCFSLADTTTGINPSSQGSFIPGNKTLNEFQTIMSNADARLHLGAVQLSNNLLGPIREMLLLHYLVHAQSENISDVEDGQATQVQIDPAILREEVPQYAMADGVMPASRIANTEAMLQALNIIQNHPMGAMEYDTIGMAVDLLKTAGFSNLHQYKRTPEEMAALQQQLGAANATDTRADQPITASRDG